MLWRGCVARQECAYVRKFLSCNHIESLRCREGNKTDLVSIDMIGQEESDNMSNTRTQAMTTDNDTCIAVGMVASQVAFNFTGDGICETQKS